MKIVVDSKTNETLKIHPNKSMISDVQNAFTALDYEANGTVGLRDIKVTLRALGIEPTATKVKKLAERSSGDKTGKLSREEYEKMLRLVLNDIDSEERMMKAYQAFDAERKHYISFGDLKKIAEQLQIDVTDEEIQEMIHFADENEDGKITMVEFTDAARKIL